MVRSTVERVLQRFVASGLTWPPDPVLTDAELERQLYRGPAQTGLAKRCVRPNWAEVAKELACKDLTRRLLWSKYCDRHANCIGYSVFCDELAAFLGDRDLAYRHDHVPGEKCYFDFAGLKLRYRDDAIRDAHIFALALGWSNAIFVYAYANETAPSWLDSGEHRAFVAFGGVTKIGVPDNPKPLITRADRYACRARQLEAPRSGGSNSSRRKDHGSGNRRGWKAVVRANPRREAVAGDRTTRCI